MRIVRIEISSLHGEVPELVFGEGATDWTDYRQLKVEGFDGSATLDLSPLWARIHGEGLSDATGECEALETIVKFGVTKQLRSEKKVRIVVQH
jgi:hypothetical protein